MKVVNLKSTAGKLPVGAVKVDRSSIYGNPFIMHDESMRHEVIEKYRRHLWTLIKDPTLGPTVVESLLDLEGKDLACWCAPLPCHADVIIRAIAWLNERSSNA